MKSRLRFLLSCAAVLSALCVAPLAQAQSPARVVTGFPPGGGVDAVARLLADHLSRQGGRPYIVEPKTGAGGAIAVQSMLSAPADGTVLLLAPDSNIVIYPHTVASPGFNPLTDLVPVGRVAAYDLALSVRGGDHPVRDFKALLAAAKADRKAATFASPAAGSLQHFYGLSVAKAAGVDLLHVPYRGVAPAVTDTIGGAVSALVTPVGAVLQHAQSGGLRIVATSGAQRGAKTPDVPTLRELGYPQLVARGWFGLFAPAKVPPETVQRIGAMVQAALNDPGFQGRLAALDMDAAWIGTQDFKAQLETENRSWQRIIQESGFRADR